MKNRVYIDSKEMDLHSRTCIDRCRFWVTIEYNKK